MARDIEEFLRRAAERRQQQKNQPGQTAPPAPTSPPPANPTKAARQPVARQTKAPIEVIEVEVVESRLTSRPKLASQFAAPAAGQPDLRSESVSDHVHRHLDSNRISSQSPSLGNRIATVHDEVDRNVHKHLDRDICSVDDKLSSSLKDQPKVANQATTQIADDLLKMLSQPRSIRQAILISEILNRPNFDEE